MGGDQGGGPGQGTRAGSRAGEQGGGAGQGLGQGTCSPLLMVFTVLPAFLPRVGISEGLEAHFRKCIQDLLLLSFRKQKA